MAGEGKVGLEGWDAGSVWGWRLCEGWHGPEGEVEHLGGGRNLLVLASARGQGPV